MSYQSTQETQPLIPNYHNHSHTSQQQQQQQQQQPHIHHPQSQHIHHPSQQQHQQQHHQQQPPSSHTQPPVSQVRDAYARRDILQSIELHNQRTQIAAETHDQAAHQSHFVGQISSTLQGVLTTMVIIQASFAAKVSYGIMFMFILSNAIANGFGFSSNEALQTISERLFVEGEAAREQWELEVNLQGEVEEMVTLYMEKGCPKHVAEAIWQNYALDPKVFLEAMMAAEIGVIYPLPPLNTKKLLKNRFLAFCIGVLVPILHFLPLLLLSKWIVFDRQFYTIISLVISLISLFYLGSQRNKGYPVTSQSDSVQLNNGLQSLFCGVICALVAFLIGKLSLYFPTGGEIL